MYDHDEPNGGEEMRGRDASRLGALMNRGEEDGNRRIGKSIPMPGFDESDHESSEEVWNASGAMTLNDYQRLRKGYERGINPEALERMEEAQGVTETPPPPLSTAPPIRIEPEIWYEPEAEMEEPIRKRGIGPVTITAILLVGIFGALILYAGGVAYITGLFKGEEPVQGENLTMVTERPNAGQEMIDPNGALTPGEEMELEDEAVVEEDETQKEQEEATRLAQEEEKKRKEEEQKIALQKEKEAAALKAQKEAAAKKAAEEARKPERITLQSGAEEPKEGADRTTTLTAASESRTKLEPAKSTSTGGKYTVQVGATPDKSEADRIASRVRSKGGSNVQVISTEKNGETIYRVRFGSFGSQDEAKTKAGEMGFGDVWVVKR